MYVNGNLHNSVKYQSNSARTQSNTESNIEWSLNTHKFFLRLLHNYVFILADIILGINAQTQDQK